MKKDKKKNKRNDDIKGLEPLIVTSPQRPQEMQDEQKAADEQTQKTNNKFNRPKWYNENNAAWLAIGVNAVMIIITILLLRSTKRTIEISQKTIDESNKLFAVQNLPYLQIQNLRLSNDTLFYSIANLGQYPAKINQGAFGFPIATKAMDGLPLIDTIVVKGNLLKPLYDPTIIEAYVVKESPLNGSQRKCFPLPKNGEIMTYFAGRISYTNEGTGQKREYVFNILLPTFEFTLNVNRSLN